MSRIARAVVPGLPHHVTQRGNRRMDVFFGEDDYSRYIGLMASSCEALKVEVWAYCLMPNHIHLIVVPESEDGLRRAIGDAHRRYSRQINLREEWRGHLFQGRFASYVMDEPYLMAAARYVELNPVRAGLVQAPWDWRWSSAAAHREGRDDRLVKADPLLELAGDWPAFLGMDAEGADAETLRVHERTGRPLGKPGFVERVEGILGRTLHPARRGPKPKAAAGDAG